MVIRWTLLFEVGGVRIYLALAGIVGCLVLGAVLFWYRDVRSHPLAAISQAIVGAIGGCIAVFTATDQASKWAAVAGAAVTVADGFEKLRKAKRN
jgi:uncharacterized YccA/Bax inhibitor family protein